MTDETYVDHMGNSVMVSGGFVQCPDCGSEAELVIWGDGVDADFNCPECDNGLGIR